ncbi:MAG: HAD family hydrolase [Prochlorococcaceae cyanobacterium]
MARNAILAFVRAVSTAGSPSFVPEAERIAVFDNDGTLWPENPMPFQLAFSLDELRERLISEPALANDPAIQAGLAGDLAALLAGPQHDGLRRLLELTHTGMTTEAFTLRVNNWLAKARHPRFQRAYTACAYRPMLELLALLRAHGFRNWIVSGGGADFIRAWSEKVYGIPPEQVVGSTARTRFELRPEGPVLLKSLDNLVIDDGAAKPAGIHQAIGRRPIACFGNSDGDLEMLQYTTVAQPRPSLGLLIHHTDAVREYAYDARPRSTGRLVKALAEAPARGWTVVSIKDDWSRLF